ncbi:MAG: hypothetical protein HYX33_01110 [Actinobacteria bacterium]|nr:hypothetical protein [Actinomycetota bacterium]
MSAAVVPTRGRVDVGGPRGLEIVPTSDGPSASATDAIRLMASAPFPATHAVVVASGALAVTLSGSVARSFRLPQVVQAFDRRPPGIASLVGAAEANSCVLVRDDDWAAVVLPSLGDIGTGAATGPVAIRADGLRVAAVTASGVNEHDLARQGQVTAAHPGEFGAVSFAPDGGILVAAGGAVGPPGLARDDGPPIVELTSRGTRALARHDDGTLSVWEGPNWTRVATWTTHVPTPSGIGLSADGAIASVGSAATDGALVALHATDDGRVLRSIQNATSLAIAPDGCLLVAGPWGVAWLAPVEDAA